MKYNKGITLIALIVTIVVLLILAGITIASITGNNAPIDKAGQAKNETEIQAEMEELQQVINKAGSKSFIHGDFSGSSDINAIRSVLKKNKMIKENPDEVILEGLNKWIVTGNKTGTLYLIKSDGNVEKLNAIITEFKPLKNEKVSAISFDKNIIMCDINNKPFTVPAGFGIAKDSGLTIEEGIVIEDAFSTDEKKGSQFVWVPVNTEVNYNSNYVNSAQQKSLADSDSSIETLGATSGIIKLSRYDFTYRQDANSVSTIIQKGMQDEIIRGTSAKYVDSPNVFINTNGITYQKSGARNIEEFINKTNSANGFYIGRYEMGEENNTAVCKEGKKAYTSIERGTETNSNGTITVTGALQKSRDMYGYINGKYSSDITNSLAWDTTIVYIEKCGTNNNYAHQLRLQSTLTTTGNATNGINKDVQCNIFDMAGNVYEWSTEYSSNSELPYAYRGGAYNYDTTFVSLSAGYYNDRGVFNLGFRPILYIL